MHSPPSTNRSFLVSQNRFLFPNPLASVLLFTFFTVVVTIIRVVIVENIPMTHGAIVLQIEPLFQAGGMEEMVANGDFGRRQVVVTNGADVLVALQLSGGSVAHRVDLVDGLTALLVLVPAGARLLPDVVVSVDAHHDGPDGAPALEQHDPGPVAEEKDGEEELDSAADGANPIDVVVERLPHVVRVGVDLMCTTEMGDIYIYLIQIC